MANELKRIVILGGGFGGLHLALALEKSLAQENGVDVTLVNDENYFQYTPMLPEVVGSDIELSHVVVGTRQLFRHVHFCKGMVKSIALPDKRVTIAEGLNNARPLDIPYDYLVIGLGSVTNFYNSPGLERYALTMKTLGDAILLRNRMIELLTQADREPLAEARSAMLTFVVAGGGFSGAETAAAMNDFLKASCKFFSNLHVQDVKVVLVHPGDVILPELDEKLGMYAQKVMTVAGLDIRLKTKVLAYVDRNVQLNDGSAQGEHAVVDGRRISQSAGCSASLPKGEGSYRCQCLHGGRGLAGRVGAWRLRFDPDAYRWKILSADRPTRGGSIKGSRRQHPRAIHGGDKKPFVFRELGRVAAIGRRRGVANVLGIDFSGPIAWMMWRALNLSLIPGTQRKLRIMLDWGLDLVFPKDMVEVDVGTERDQRFGN